MAIILGNASEDGASASVAGDGSDVTVAIEAESFGGGYVRIEIKRPGGDVWTPLRVASDLSPAPIYEVTTDSVVTVNLPVGYELRAVLAGSSGASGVTVAVDN